jgi:glyoxylase-like metal-dependent hydrolase (beta-lactamase superfamily II)
MKRILLLFTSAGAVACASSNRAAREPSGPVSVGDVVVTPVAEGVYAAIRREPLAQAVNANSLFIVGDDGVVSVDAQFTRAATLENLAALRRITTKPVRYVINTHWHDDHVAGDQVYRDTFPDVRFVSHANTRIDLVEKGRPNRESQLKFAPGAANYFERLLNAGLALDSTPITAGERASQASAVRIVRQYAAENAGYREILADTLVDRVMKLALGRRTIELHWFGRANTRGDLVTYLPAEGVVSVGDLLVHPVPFGFNSYPTEWIAVLDSVERLRPRVIVPGHGPIMHDMNYLRTVRRLLSVARDRTLREVAKGNSVDSVLRVVTLDDLRAELAGDDKWTGTMFNMFFRGPIVRRLYDEAKNGPLK